MIVVEAAVSTVLDARLHHDSLDFLIDVASIKPSFPAKQALLPPWATATLAFSTFVTDTWLNRNVVGNGKFLRGNAMQLQLEGPNTDGPALRR